MKTVLPVTLIQRICQAGLLGSCLIATGCGEPPPVEQDEAVRPVRYVEVETGALKVTRTFSGSARADVEADISFKVAGTVNSRPVEVGESVKKGQLLASLDARDFTIRLREAEAQLASARAALRNAESAYTRTRDLYENDNVAKSELDSARAASESATAQVRIAEQNLANNQLQMSYTRVVAPETCDIAETFVKENENVTSGQAIVRLNCGHCAEVHVAVPETQIAGISEGDKAAVKFDALPDTEFVATVSEVGVAMSSERASFPVVLRLKDACERVRPGMAADVSFRFGNADDTSIVVPTVAVGEDSDGRFVYVLEPLDASRWRAQRRSVDTGEVIYGGIIITGGLEGGERIATAGVRRIADGMVVRLYEGG